jgi:hypothetical protein
MFKFNAQLTVIIVGLVLAACGRTPQKILDQGSGTSGFQTDKTSNTSVESIEVPRWIDGALSYNGYFLSDDSCQTGSHYFASFDQYCQGLLNEELNNYCAAGKRQTIHDRNCKNGNTSLVFDGSFRGQKPIMGYHIGSDETCSITIDNLMSHSDYCSALLDEALNHYCAAPSRQKKYELTCRK